MLLLPHAASLIPREDGSHPDSHAHTCLLGGALSSIPGYIMSPAHTCAITCLPPKIWRKLLK